MYLKRAFCYPLYTYLVKPATCTRRLLGRNYGYAGLRPPSSTKAADVRSRISGNADPGILPGDLIPSQRSVDVTAIVASTCEEPMCWTYTDKCEWHASIDDSNNRLSVCHHGSLVCITYLCSGTTFGRLWPFKHAMMLSSTIRAILSRESQVLGQERQHDSSWHFKRETAAHSVPI